MTDQIWYKKIGFFSNPFGIKPAAFHNELFGLNDKIKEMVNLINSGKCFFIEGEYGSGKTTALKRLIKEFSGQGKLIYYSFSLSSKALNIDKLLVGRSGFFGRMFGIKSKDVILLLDEVQDMTLKDAEKIKEFFETKNFKSIVFVGKEINNKLPKEVKSLIGNNIFTFKGLDDKDAISLVRKRVGKLKLIPDDIIKKINKISNNPRDLLKNMEDITRYAVENEEKEINEAIIKAVNN